MDGACPFGLVAIDMFCRIFGIVSETAEIRRPVLPKNKPSLRLFNPCCALSDWTQSDCVVRALLQP